MFFYSHIDIWLQVVSYSVCETLANDLSTYIAVLYNTQPDSTKPQLSLAAPSLLLSGSYHSGSGTWA